MSEQYFLGREATGDEESGPDGGECYDGYIWCVDPDESEPRPAIFASIDGEEEAARVLKVIQNREALLSACLATVAMYDDLAWHRDKVRAARGETSPLPDPDFIRLCKEAISKARTP